jgi:hypothetical protein
MGTVTGPRPGLKQRGHCSDRRITSDNPQYFGVIVSRFLFRKNANSYSCTGMENLTPPISHWSINGAFIVMDSEIICAAKQVNLIAVISLPGVDGAGPRKALWASITRATFPHGGTC